MKTEESQKNGKKRQADHHCETRESFCYVVGGYRCLCRIVKLIVFGLKWNKRWCVLAREGVWCDYFQNGDPQRHEDQTRGGHSLLCAMLFGPRDGPYPVN